MARKNRIICPSRVLHFFNILKVEDSMLESLFSSFGAPVPNQIKWVSSKNDGKQGGLGLCYFESVNDATTAMILVNHAQIETRNIKFCYSPAKY